MTQGHLATRFRIQPCLCTEARDLALYSDHWQPHATNPPPTPLCIKNSEYHTAFLSRLLFLRSVRRLIVTPSIVRSPSILVILMKEKLSTYETSVLTRPTRRNIPEDTNLQSHRLENLKTYIALSGWGLQRRRNVSPVRYELCFLMLEDDILHSNGCDHLKSYIALTDCALYRRCNVSPVTYDLGFCTRRLHSSE
jgi:hypothetical protein